MYEASVCPEVTRPGVVITTTSHHSAGQGVEPWTTGDDARLTPDPLSALVGVTRSRLLRLLSRAAMSTSELARSMGVSESTVSEHTRVLRSAGLLVSERHGRRVVHCATAQGKALAADRPLTADRDSSFKAF